MVEDVVKMIVKEVKRKGVCAFNCNDSIGIELESLKQYDIETEKIAQHTFICFPTGLEEREKEILKERMLIKISSRHVVDNIIKMYIETI